MGLPSAPATAAGHPPEDLVDDPDVGGLLERGVEIVDAHRVHVDRLLGPGGMLLLLG